MRTRLLNPLARPWSSRAPGVTANGWICASCSAKAPRSSRPYSDATRPTKAPEKPYYVTTPIFYVNAAPHVGHLYTMVLTDILKRYQVLGGKKAILVTGTDEHGMKIQQAAALAGSEPKPFCDKGAEVFLDLAKQANISYDHFVRTTDPDHREAVEYAWHVLQERGYIYTSKHEGWYSISDETFYPQSAVHLILDPRTGRKMMVSIESSKEVEWTSETNHHFRLSALRDQLLAFYAANPTFVVPASRMAEITTAVRTSLTDLSISRPVSRLSWGIRVPGDASQTIYVWFDALLNYLTKAGYPWPPGQQHTLGWPADVQVLGKDILRFHAIYLPALLLALDIPPARQLLTHAHWTLAAQKMSKSTGNVVNPFFALDRFGTDPMRYYLAHDGGLDNDSDYTNPHIIERYKKGLQGGLGNLASRVLRGKGWDTRAAVEEGVRVASFDALGESQRRKLDRIRPRVDAAFAALDVSSALKHIMDLVFETNRYLHFSSPWSLVARPSPATHARVTATMYLSLEALRLSAILLQPFIPEKAAELLDMLGVARERRRWDDAVLGADDAYGAPLETVELGAGKDGVLFPPLRSDN